MLGIDQDLGDVGIIYVWRMDHSQRNTEINLMRDAADGQSNACLLTLTSHWLMKHGHRSSYPRVHQAVRTLASSIASVYRSSAACRRSPRFRLSEHHLGADVLKLGACPAKELM